MRLQITHRNLSLSPLAAYIPPVTIVTCVLSLVLARATFRIIERRLLLACEEFEREWTRELHIKLERVPDKEAASSSPILAKFPCSRR